MSHLDRNEYNTAACLEENAVPITCDCIDEINVISFTIQVWGRGHTWPLFNDHVSNAHVILVTFLMVKSTKVNVINVNLKRYNKVLIGAI